MGVTGGDPVSRGKISSSHLHFLSDPLAPVRAFTISHPGLNVSQPRLSYSSSNGSDHSHIKLDFSNSAAASSGSGGSRNSLITNGGRKSSSFNKADDKRETFNLTLDFPQHKLGNGNGTLDFPNLKICSNNNNDTLDHPHIRLGATNSSPGHNRRKEAISIEQHFNNRNNNANNSSSVQTDFNSSPQMSYGGPLIINDSFYNNKNNGASHPPKGPSLRKISNRSLHGVFHSRLSGPLASLQPVAAGLRPQSTRARKKRHSAIAFFNNRDKENVQLELSSPNDSDASLNTNLPSVLHQLATMCRPGVNNNTNNTLAGGIIRPLGQGLSASDTSLIVPAGLNGPVTRPEHESSDSGRARKVSLVLRALAGRLSLSLGKGEGLSTLAVDHQLPISPRPRVGFPTSPPLPPPNPPPTLPPLIATLSAVSSASSSSNGGKSYHITF